MLTWLTASLLYAQAPTPGVAAPPVPVRLSVGQEGEACLMMLAGQRISFSARSPDAAGRQHVEAALRVLKGRNIELQLVALPGHQPHYRCIGGIVHEAQRLRLRVGFISEPVSP